MSTEDNLSTTSTKRSSVPPPLPTLSPLSPSSSSSVPPPLPGHIASKQTSESFVKTLPNHKTIDLSSLQTSPNNFAFLSPTSTTTIEEQSSESTASTNPSNPKPYRQYKSMPASESTFLSMAMKEPNTPTPTPIPTLSFTQYMSELQTLKYYLNIGIQQRRAETLKLTIDKVQDLISNHPEHHKMSFDKSETQEDASKLEILLREARELSASLTQENIDSIHYYVKQGLNTKNRDILREVMLKSCLLDKNSLDANLLKKGEVLLRMLDEIHMARTTLTDAMNSKNLEIIQLALSHATPVLSSSGKYGNATCEYKDLLSSNDAKLLTEANKLHQQLLRKSASTQAAKNASTMPHKPIIVDKLNGGEFERIANIFHVITPVSTGLHYAHTPSEEDIALQEYASNIYTKVPLIIYDCIQYILSNHGLEEVGIFRQAGSQDTMIDLFSAYESLYTTVKRRGGVVSEDQSDKYVKPQDRAEEYPLPSVMYDTFTSVHDAANVLKRFLRQLSEPIIPYEEYTKWLSIGNGLRNDTVLKASSQLNGASVLNMTSRLMNSTPIGGGSGSGSTDTTTVSSPSSSLAALVNSMAIHTTYEKSASLKELKLAIESLSPLRQSLLQYLCIFLYGVALNQAQNKMTPDNLSIVFVTNLIKPKVETQSTMVSDSPIMMFLVQCLIRYAPVLFTAQE